jgi:hypothetical protein
MLPVRAAAGEPFPGMLLSTRGEVDAAQAGGGTLNLFESDCPSFRGVGRADPLHYCYTDGL